MMYGKASLKKAHKWQKKEYIIRLNEIKPNLIKAKMQVNTDPAEVTAK